MSDRRAVDGDLATEPLQPDKSLGDLFGDLTSDLSALFRQEVELAKTEARQELRASGRAAAMFGGATVGAWLALLFVSLAGAALLDRALDTDLSFLIVAIVWAVAAAVLAARGKRRMAAIEPIPETVQTLKEDVQWARTQTN